MAKISRFTAYEVARKMVDDVYRDRENYIRKKIQESCEVIAKKTNTPRGIGHLQEMGAVHRCLSHPFDCMFR